MYLSHRGPVLFKEDLAAASRTGAEEGQIPLCLIPLYGGSKGFHSGIGAKRPSTHLIESYTDKTGEC